MTSLPNTATTSKGWTRVILRGIKITGGSCEFGVYSDANAGNWCLIDSFAMVRDDVDYTFLQGGDVSRLTQVEKAGLKFSDSTGTQGDAMQILSANGFNFVRLRAYVDPGNPSYAPSNRLPAGIQTTADILTLAKRAAAKGMKIQLTLHYTDYWGDGGVQDVPHQWKCLTFAAEKQKLYDYTYSIVSQLVAQGTPPWIVSLGNQMQGGILLQQNYPSTTVDGYGSVSNWTNLASLLNAGYSAVKAASSSSLVMLHINTSTNASWFYSGANSAGVKYDVLGISYYPYWFQSGIGTVETAAADLAKAATSFGKDIYIMETAVNWSHLAQSGYTGQLVNNGVSGYPETAAGQRDYLYDFIDAMKNIDNGRVKGILWWDPVYIGNLGWEVGATGGEVNNSAVFDFTGKALPVLSQAYRYNR